MITKKLLSVLLALIMAVSTVATLAITAGAAATDSVTYFENNENATGEVAEHNDDPLNNQHLTANVTIAGKGTLAVEGFVFAGWNTQADGKGTTYQPGTSIVISEPLDLYAIWVNADGKTSYLDLETSTTDILEKKTLDQNYNLSVNEGSYTDVTKVNLTWEIKDIGAARTDNMVWDTTELKWVVASSSTNISDKGTAKFTLKNYSSVMIDATVLFEAADDLTCTVEYSETDGEITIDTAADNDTYSKTNVPTGEITVTVTPSDNYFTEKTAATAVKYGTYTVTIEEYEVPACIASGAMVTLADGTKKVIDDVTVNDRLLTYNFFTGEIEGNKPLYIIKNDNIVSSVITLYFSDGSNLEMCDEQSFFDMDARDYILISRKNYQNAVGKRIMQIKDGMIEEVTITNISVEKRYCTSYELATENAVNFVTNDIVNTPPEYFLPGTYTVGEDMKIDDEQYQKDVAQYGLYTYADFEKYISENTFITGHIADVKIAVGKGLISEEAVFACYEEWTPVIHGDNQ